MAIYRPTFAVLLCIALHCCCSRALAIDPADVLVLYNSNPAVPESLQIANYYKQVYPDVTLMGLNLGTSSTITASDFLTNIRDPILNGPEFTPSTDLIITTKGMPLKVHVEAANPGNYTDAWGNNRIVWNWRTESSLESELAKIDYVASELMMGDQSFNQPVGGDHFTKNLYYQSTAPFSAANFSNDSAMRLTARLDGFTAGDVTNAIDRAQNAFVGPNDTPSGPFHFLVDQDSPGSLNELASPTMTNLGENVLPTAGLPLTYENTSAFQSSAGGPVIGYTGHGANQASTPGYTPGVGSYLVTSLDIELADGAVFNSWESFNAQSFDFEGNFGNQALLAEWLAKGGTAGVGNVNEPQGSPLTVFNEDQLFSMLIGGKTFAEAAWSSARQLSWVNTIVGDPLMTWKQLLPGDANMDGVVDMDDLAVMVDNWHTSVDDGGFGWGLGDLDGSGDIGVADLELWNGSLGQVSGWSSESPNLLAPTNPLALALYQSMRPNPEPSTIALAGIGLAVLAAFGWRRRRALRRR